MLGSDVALMANARGSVLPAPQTAGEMLEYCQLMAKAGPMVGKAFRDNPGACLGIYAQASRWNMDPFAVSQQAYVVPGKDGGETIAYMSQLVNAVINSSQLIVGRLRPRFEGEGLQRKVFVSGYIAGDPEPFVYESPVLSSCKRDNGSPVWKTDPDRQLFYYASRAWARLYVPELLMGVYTTDEMQPAPRNVTPPATEAKRATLADLDRENVIDEPYEDGLPVTDVNEDVTDVEPELTEQAAGSVPVETAAKDGGEDNDPPAPESSSPSKPSQSALNLEDGLPKLPQIDFGNADDKEVKYWKGAMITHLQARPVDDARLFWLNQMGPLEECNTVYPDVYEDLAAAFEEKTKGVE